MKLNQSFENTLDRLKLEQLDTYLYRYKGKNAGIQRIYGGQVIAQAYIAANSTIEEDKHLHSLHAYFLRPGIMKQPVLFSVDPIRNGKSFSTRTRRQHFSICSSTNRSGDIFLILHNYSIIRVTLITPCDTL